MNTWSPESWRQRPAAHQIDYPNPSELESVLETLTRLPPLVFPGELSDLKAQIAAAGRGEHFIIHGGDCVERFSDCNQETITNKIKIILQMSMILAYGLRMPVVRIGRIAGQYFKPRSRSTETIDGTQVLTYRGDTVNGYAPDEREPDPRRLEQGYFHAAATLNYIRAMISGGFTDLHYPYTWNLFSIEQTPQWAEYRHVVDRILEAIHFMESIGGTRPETLNKVQFFTSHEGLHLPYETALTRNTPEGSWYNAGAHMLWIGERTRLPQGAHAEYFRGIMNPLGIKVSATEKPQELIELIQLLNPDNIPGRITLITRMGSKGVETHLRGLIRAVQQAGLTVTWSCDPMHGNGMVTPKGTKTRHFSDILQELTRTYELHLAEGTVLGGVHFELTGEEVTECLGGAVDLTEGDLEHNFQSYCDPRLNYAQSMEMAFLIAGLMKKTK